MKRKYLILFSLSGLVLCCDQLTKHLAIMYLQPDIVREVIPGFLSLVLARNNGFAFGMLQRAPASLQDIFFIAVPVFALILIVLIFIKLRDDQMLTSVALTTILGGAIGNLIDRIQYGSVVDFLDLHWQASFHLPPLNVADISILFGVALMFFSTLTQKEAVKIGI
jgi:signal peptidase II